MYFHAKISRYAMNKKLKLIFFIANSFVLNILFLNMAFASVPLSPPNAFNLSGVHQDTMIQSCQEIPCSIAKVIKTETIKQNAESTVVQLTLLGGLQEQQHQDIVWNDQPHQVSVNCSTQNPSIEMFNHKMPIYFIPDEPILASDVTLYLKTCHNLSQSNGQDLKSRGYALNTFISP